MRTCCGTASFGDAHGGVHSLPRGSFTSTIPSAASAAEKRSAHADRSTAIRAARAAIVGEGRDLRACETRDVAYVFSS